MAEVIDIDGDGWDELWIHSGAFSSIVSPRRGGAVETLLRFADLSNVADTLTRRHEAYHDAPPASSGSPDGDTTAGLSSIHELERATLPPGGAHPPVDAEGRAILVDRVLAPELTLEAYAGARYAPLTSWADVAMTPMLRDEAEALVIELRGGGLSKVLRFTTAGDLSVAYRWDPRRFPAGALFAPELSLAGEMKLVSVPVAEVWRYPITTVAKSERGLEEVEQGIALTPRWPIALGAARLELRLSAPAAT